MMSHKNGQDRKAFPISRASLRLKRKIDFLEREQYENMSREEILEAVHELQARQSALEQQNEQLRQSHAELDMERKHFIEFLEHAQPGYLIADENEKESVRIRALLETAGRIAKFGGWSVTRPENVVFMSREVAAIHDLPLDYHPTVEEAIAFYTPQWRDKITAAFNLCATRGVPFDEEMEIITRKGRHKWIRTTGEALRDKSGDICQVAGAFQDITQRKLADDALQASLKEKEMLLQEVHHRVKNNLAVICALLDMQRQSVNDPATESVLADLDARIRSIALVHEQLYDNEKLSSINFQDYLDILLRDVIHSLRNGEDILYRADAHNINLGIDSAIPCGMIINELVTNAIKYAFPDGKTFDGEAQPEVRVELRENNGMYHIMVADNGVGFPAEVDLHSSQSFGLSLIRMLGSHQLGGTLKLERDKGTQVIFSFEPEHKEAP
ncbi:MAG: sensor histidine kinase [Desulfonatronovibrio sp.]